MIVKIKDNRIVTGKGSCDSRSLFFGKYDVFIFFKRALLHGETQRHGKLSKWFVISAESAGA